MAYPFTDQATFYVETVATGEMTTVYAANIACRLTKPKGVATSSPDRAALASERDFIFDPAVELPEFGEIIITGHAGRWAPVSGTYGFLLGPTGLPHHRRVIVRRQVV